MFVATWYPLSLASVPGTMTIVVFANGILEIDLEQHSGPEPSCFGVHGTSSFCVTGSWWKRLGYENREVSNEVWRNRQGPTMTRERFEVCRDCRE